MPFSLGPLSQDSSPQISPGCTTYAVTPGAGAVMEQEYHSSLFNLRKQFLGNALGILNSK
jgi:hypothetical protein